MEFREYPKALERGAEFTTAADAEAEAALRSDGWHVHGETPPEPAADEKAKLLTQAKALGIDADSRWGEKRLRAAIEAARPLV